MTLGNGTRRLLKMKGRQKMLQEWQVYHTMTYETQWKNIINVEWEKYKSVQEAEKPSEELDETRFTFMASFMRQKYLEETNEVQEKVRQRREELKSENGGGEGEEKNVGYQEYLDFIHSQLNITDQPVVQLTTSLGP